MWHWLQFSQYSGYFQRRMPCKRCDQYVFLEKVLLVGFHSIILWSKALSRGDPLANTVCVLNICRMWFLRLTFPQCGFVTSFPPACPKCCKCPWLRDCFPLKMTGVRYQLLSNTGTTQIPMFFSGPSENHGVVVNDVNVLIQLRKTFNRKHKMMKLYVKFL